jgi:hypothetical protein
MKYTLTLFVNLIDSLKVMIVMTITTWTSTYKMNTMNIHKMKLSIDASLIIITLCRQEYYRAAQ